MNSVTLRELEIGDRFYPVSRIGKSSPIYEVVGLPMFNIRHGSATRYCINLKTGFTESKSCRLEVIKTKQKP